MSFNDLFSGGSTSAFNKNSVVGETVSGPIVSAVQRQVTDYVTKAPETWDNGDPKLQAVITIKTDLRVDENDEGNRSIYIKTWGLDKQALIAAVQAAGFADVNSALAPGNIFTASFTGTQPSKYGSDQKIYAYQIQRGANLPAMTTPAQPPAQQYTQPPAPAPAPVATPPVQYAQAAPTPAPAAPATPDVPSMIAAGLTDQQIAAATGADPAIIAIARNSLTN